MKNIKFNDLKNYSIIAILTFVGYFAQDLYTKVTTLTIDVAVIKTEVRVLIRDNEMKKYHQLEIVQSENNLESTQNYISHPLSISDLDI